MTREDAVLVDTDVFSYLLKGKEPEASRYRPEVEGRLVAVSFMTVGELEYGAEKRGWGPAQRQKLADHLRKVVVVPYDYEICVTYGRLRNAVERAGRPVALHDLWIAACAVRHGIPLVSNNARHFTGVPGLELRSRVGL